MKMFYKKNFSALLFFLALCPAMLFAQTHQITGTVVSVENKQPLSGVTVTARGAKAATVTDNQGHYSIKVDDKTTALLFTSASFVNYSGAVTASTTEMNVELAPDTRSLNDVVVIGYQTVRRKDLLASVSSLSTRDMKDIPINSAAEALNGRLAGVTATTAEGSPDAQITVRVRGGMSITQDNTPLYIVDGVQMENALSFISPQDIASIDVLKDAAAKAIYGARGANGVIIITTKGGRKQKPTVSYNGFFGVKTLAREQKVMSPYQYVLYQSERSRGSSTDSLTFLKNFGTYFDTLSVYKDVPAVDWQKQAFGKTGYTQTHNISVTGGTNFVTYTAGYTLNDDQAIVLNSRYRRHLFNTKMDFNITKKLRAGVSARYTLQEVYGAGVSDAKGSSYNRLRNAVKYRPFLSNGELITDQDPLADPNVGNGLNLYNPIDLANAEYRQKTTHNFGGNVYVQYAISKHLSSSSTFGYDYYKFIDRQFEDTITPFALIQGGKKPTAQLDTTQQYNYINSNVLTYSVKGWHKKHDLDVVVGEETNDLKSTITNDLFKNYPSFTSPTDAFKNTSVATSFAGYPRLTKTRATMASLFGRLSYGFADKYLLSVNFRADGSSKFLPGKQWGYFPSGSLAWRIKNEKFLQHVDFINDLKIRAGYGVVGNNRIGDYLYLTSFSNNGTYYYGLNNTAILGYFPASLVNANLKWESSEEKNIGMDLSILKNRVNLSVDIYNNTSRDLLLNVPIDPTYGFTTQFQNIGKTSNKGVELQLYAAIIRHPKGFNWNASFNISFNHNKIVQLGTGQTQFFPAASWGVSGQPADYIVKIGEQVGAIYGLVADGFYNVNDFDYNTSTGVYTLKSGVVSDAAIIGTVMPGSIKFKDLNGDGQVDLNNDRKIIGHPYPKFTGGLNQQFTYKNWDLSFFVNFSYGNDVYNANKIELTNGYANDANMLKIMEGRWKIVTPTGQTAEWINGNSVMGIPPDQLAALNANATIWQPIKSAGAFYPSSWAIENGSFLRFNNLTIGYNFPASKLAGSFISKLRVYATANNFGILTKYTGYDPEVSVSSSPLTPGLDYSAYPKSRSFLFGINATF